jgi:hypothetical protein
LPKGSVSPGLPHILHDDPIDRVTRVCPEPTAFREAVCSTSLPRRPADGTWKVHFVRPADCIRAARHTYGWCLMPKLNYEQLVSIIQASSSARKRAGMQTIWTGHRLVNTHKPLVVMLCPQEVGMYSNSRVPGLERLRRDGRLENSLLTTATTPARPAIKMILVEHLQTLASGSSAYSVTTESMFKVRNSLIRFDRDGHRPTPLWRASKSVVLGLCLSTPPPGWVDLCRFHLTLCSYISLGE